MKVNHRNLWLSIASLLGLASSIGCTYDPPSAGNGGAGGDAGGTSVGGAGGGAQGHEMDCLDGLDDDSDGKIDCADSDCVPGYECVPIAPAGSGPYVRIVQTTAETKPVKCTVDGSEPVVRGKNPVQPQCTACECTVSNINCRTEVIEVHSSMGCNSLITKINPSSACVTVPPAPQGSYSLTINPPPADVSVTAPVVTPENPWQDVLHVCPAYGNATGAGCGDGQFCVPRVSVPYETRMCVHAMGELSCTGEYSEKITAFDGINDSRGCSSCSCDAKWQCFGYTAKLDSAPTCNGMTEQFVAFDSCIPSTFPTAAVELGNPTPQVLKNVPIGGGPTGVVTPSNPRTFCCTP